MHHPHTRLGEEGASCSSCSLNILIKPSLMEVVQALNPGQPELPDWVYNGAILGVQGGTDRMLQHLAEARQHGIQVAAARGTSTRWPACGSRTGPARSSPTSGRACSGTGGGTRRGTPGWTQSSGGSQRRQRLQGPRRRGGQGDGLHHRPPQRAGRRVRRGGGGGWGGGDRPQEDYWLTTEDGAQLQQDYGHFDVATVDVMEVPQDCNCINTARIW